MGRGHGGCKLVSCIGLFNQMLKVTLNQTTIHVCKQTCHFAWCIHMYIIFCSFLLLGGNSTWTLFGNSVSYRQSERYLLIQGQPCICFSIAIYLKMKIRNAYFNVKLNNNFQEAMLSVTLKFSFYFSFTPISDQTCLLGSHVPKWVSMYVFPCLTVLIPFPQYLWTTW